MTTQIQAENLQLLNLSSNVSLPQNSNSLISQDFSSFFSSFLNSQNKNNDQTNSQYSSFPSLFQNQAANIDLLMSNSLFQLSSEKLQDDPLPQKQPDYLSDKTVNSFKENVAKKIDSLKKSQSKVSPKKDDYYQKALAEKSRLEKIQTQKSQEKTRENQRIRQKNSTSKQTSTDQTNQDNVDSNYSSQNTSSVDSTNSVQKDSQISANSSNSDVGVSSNLPVKNPSSSEDNKKQIEEKVFSLLKDDKIQQYKEDPDSYFNSNNVAQNLLNDLDDNKIKTELGKLFSGDSAENKGNANAVNGQNPNVPDDQGKFLIADILGTGKNSDQNPLNGDKKQTNPTDFRKLLLGEIKKNKTGEKSGTGEKISDGQNKGDLTPGQVVLPNLSEDDKKSLMANVSDDAKKLLEKLQKEEMLHNSNEKTTSSVIDPKSEGKKVTQNLDSKNSTNNVIQAEDPLVQQASQEKTQEISANTKADLLNTSLNTAQDTNSSTNPTDPTSGKTTQDSASQHSENTDSTQNDNKNDIQNGKQLKESKIEEILKTLSKSKPGETGNAKKVLDITPDKTPSVKNSASQETPTDPSLSTLLAQKFDDRIRLGRRNNGSEMNVASTNGSLSNTEATDSGKLSKAEAKLFTQNNSSTDEFKSKVDKALHGSENQKTVKPEAGTKPSTNSHSQNNNSGSNPEMNFGKNTTLANIQTKQVAGSESVKTSIFSQIIEKIQMVQDLQNVKTLSVNLKPEALGKLDIHLTSNDGNVNARIHAENATVREHLESLIPQIKNHLSEQGINIHNIVVDVFAKPSDDRNKGSFSKNQKQNNKISGISSSKSNDGTIDEEETIPEEEKTDGTIDIKV
ncbi:MAG: flagellar hook-length control protein FliK [Candidatus Riflebacteria bacterium]|nr:flagellar hook-length control protein FliK [Candidatus Riflebacteria bacterium]